MFDFHSDTQRYFEMQEINSRESIIPFIEETAVIKKGSRVLEIGCGEGGVLKAFLDRGCQGVGIELDEHKLKQAEVFLADYIVKGQCRLIAKDIYEVDPEREFEQKFDVIILKDVIEHIHDKEKLIAGLKIFLNPQGIIFFGFPPWQMPFGGHQQMCRGKISKLPYIHLLPKRIYKWILTVNKESWQELIELKEIGVSIEQFRKISKETGYKIMNEYHYLINPIYRYKFNWKVRKQYGFIKAVPYMRNFLTTSVYFLIQPQI